MRTRYKFIQEGDKWVAIEAHLAPLPERISPVVHQDSMPATWHPCDGKIYESKSAFRRTTRAHGCDEVGNESFESLKRDAERYRGDPSSDLKQEIARAYDQLRGRS